MILQQSTEDPQHASVQIAQCHALKRNLAKQADIPCVKQKHDKCVSPLKDFICHLSIVISDHLRVYHVELTQLKHHMDETKGCMIQNLVLGIQEQLGLQSP